MHSKFQILQKVVRGTSRRDSNRSHEQKDFRDVRDRRCRHQRRQRHRARHDEVRQGGECCQVVFRGDEDRFRVRVRFKTRGTGGEIRF